MNAQIVALAETPMEQLRFRDFARLRIGRDEYSSKRLPALEAAVSAEDRALVESDPRFDDHKNRAVVYRWILRGLPAEKAKRKVLTDLEIGTNAAHAYFEANRY